MICLYEYLTRAGYARPADCAVSAEDTPGAEKMRVVTGVSATEFGCGEYIPENAYGVRILECRSLDSLAVLPDEINGLPVAELAPYLFSAPGNWEDGAATGAFWWPETENAESLPERMAGSLGKQEEELPAVKTAEPSAAERTAECTEPSAAERTAERTEPSAAERTEPSAAERTESPASERTESPAAERTAEPAVDHADPALWRDLPPLRGDRLEELRLPARLEKVGAYALYNCEKLKKLELYSTTLDWGAGVFTGCYGVEQVTIHVDENRKSCMREVLAELRQTLEVLYLQEEETGVNSIRASSSGDSLEATARLIFPEFFEEAIENTPARILVTETHGCGQKYRNAFVSTQFQFKEYDSLFPHVQVQEPEALVARLALGRLMYPYRLEERHAERYREYLEEHVAAAAGWAVGSGDMRALEWIFAHIPCGGEMIAGLLDIAGTCKNGAAVSFLMDKRRAAGAVTRKRFSL